MITITPTPTMARRIYAAHLPSGVRALEALRGDAKPWQQEVIDLRILEVRERNRQNKPWKRRARQRARAAMEDAR